MSRSDPFSIWLRMMARLREYAIDLVRNYVNQFWNCHPVGGMIHAGNQHHSPKRPRHPRRRPFGLEGKQRILEFSPSKQVLRAQRLSASSGLPAWNCLNLADARSSATRREYVRP